MGLDMGIPISRLLESNIGGNKLIGHYFENKQKSI
jgi:hypothetical protein